MSRQFTDVWLPRYINTRINPRLILRTGADVHLIPESNLLLVPVTIDSVWCYVEINMDALFTFVFENYYTPY